MRSVGIIAMISLAGTFAQAQIVTNVIDSFTTAQTLSVVSGYGTSTIAAAGAIGGYRTFTLNVANTDEEPVTLISSTNSRRLNLNSPTGATADFTVTWGGLGGTNGLGGVDLLGGNPTASQSSLKFNLRSTDWPSTFTWSFTDTLSQTATYSGTFQQHAATSPQVAYDIALTSFTGSINWKSINFITLSGGGVAELDLSLSALNVPLSIQTTAMAPVPEPGTWAAAALLAGVAGFIHWRRRRVDA